MNKDTIKLLNKYLEKVEFGEIKLIIHNKEITKFEIIEKVKVIK